MFKSVCTKSPIYRVGPVGVLTPGCYLKPMGISNHNFFTKLRQPPELKVNSFGTLTGHGLIRNGSNLNSKYWSLIDAPKGLLSTSAGTGPTSGTLPFGLLLGAIGMSVLLKKESIVKNETQALSNYDYGLGTLGEAVNEAKDAFTQEQSTIKSTSKTRFNGKLNYEQLTYGSFLGLFLGISTAKLSGILYFASLSTYLILQFLASRGIIRIPFTKIITIGAKKIDARRLFFEQPSFKFSLISAYVIAYFNT